MKAIKGIYPTMCPTFPRSGNTFLMLVLRDYFGKDRFRFADSHKHPGRGFESDPQCVFQKTHDFNLNTPQVKRYQYLVQIRHPIDALASWEALKNREKTMTLSRRTWWAQRMQYYADFVKRWILKPIDRRLVVDFQELMGDPIPTIGGIIDFVTMDEKVDTDKLTKVVLTRQRPSGHKRKVPYARLP